MIGISVVVEATNMYVRVESYFALNIII